MTFIHEYDMSIDCAMNQIDLHSDTLRMALRAAQEPTSRRDAYINVAARSARLAFRFATQIEKLEVAL